MATRGKDYVVDGQPRVPRSSSGCRPLWPAPWNWIAPSRNGLVAVPPCRVPSSAGGQVNWIAGCLSGAFAARTQVLLKKMAKLFSNARKSTNQLNPWRNACPKRCAAFPSPSRSRVSAGFHAPHQWMEVAAPSWTGWTRRWMHYANRCSPMKCTTDRQQMCHK